MKEFINNIFENYPVSKDEFFESLLQNKNIKLERIISSGQATPKDEWLQQETDEWVILLRGSAGIKFENNPNIIELKPGDYLTIPAQTRHRVEWTDKNTETIWLALHYL